MFVEIIKILIHILVLLILFILYHGSGITINYNGDDTNKPISISNISVTADTDNDKVTLAFRVNNLREDTIRVCGTLKYIGTDRQI